jgi:hypothetical protein
VAEPSASVLTPDQRIANYRRTRDPQDMWPDTTDRERIAAYREMVSATRLILAGEKASLSPEAPSAVRSAGVSAFMSGMGPLLGWWVERGQLQVSEPLSELLGDHLAHGRRRATDMVARLTHAVRAMREQGIVPSVLKGTYTARRYFTDPGSRAAADIDLLIGPEQTDAAARALSSLGLKKITFHTAPYREDWGLEEHPSVRSADMSHAENPWTVDLHYSLDRLYFPGLVASFEPVREELVEPWSSPSGPVTVLRQPWLTAYLALHAGADFPHVPLIRIVELIRVLRADIPRGALSWDSLAEALRRLDLRRLAYPAFALAATMAPADIDPAFLRELSEDTTARMRRIVPIVLESPHFSRLSFEVRLVWARGAREILQNVMDWVYPKGPAITPRVRLRIARRRLALLFGGRIGILPGNDDD